MIGLLCLDHGTSSAKAALIDLDGRTLAAGSASYVTTTLPGGGAEQDPEDWLRAARTAIGQATTAGIEVAALCLTGQMQDLILEGEHGALRPAVLYTDQRAASDVQQLRTALAQEGTDWDAVTGNRQDPSSCAAMFRRLVRTEPAVTARAHGLTFGPAGHLAARLGAGLWCDLTTASTTGLLDATTRDWHPGVARAAGLEPALLPRLTRGHGQVVGRTDARARDLLGLEAGVPIVLAPGDAGAAALGVTGTATGKDHASLGTSGWIASIRPRDTASDPVQFTPASHRLALGEDELLISAVLAGGAAAAWARDAYLGGRDAHTADALLAERERLHGRGPTGLLVLPSLGGERFPVRDDALRGAVLGLHAGTGPAELYAGTLEGVALALSHALDLASAGEELTVVGGGAASAPWRRILADVTGRPVRSLSAPGADATLLGTAIAGAETLGLDHDIAPLAERDGELTVPDPAAAQAYAALRPAHRALYDAAARIGDLAARS